MGLLDSVLGGVLGGGMAPGQRSGTAGGGTALLMQIVAALLASRCRRVSSAMCWGATCWAN